VSDCLYFVEFNQYFKCVTLANKFSFVTSFMLLTLITDKHRKPVMVVYSDFANIL